VQVFILQSLYQEYALRYVCRWDRDGISNLDEVLDGVPKTNPFDPTNSFGECKNEKVNYLDKLGEYSDSKMCEVAKKLNKTLSFVEDYPKVSELISRHGVDVLVHLLDEMLSEEEYRELLTNERCKQLLHSINLLIFPKNVLIKFLTLYIAPSTPHGTPCSAH